VDRFGGSDSGEFFTLTRPGKFFPFGDRRAFCSIRRSFSFLFQNRISTSFLFKHYDIKNLTNQAKSVSSSATGAAVAVAKNETLPNPINQEFTQRFEDGCGTESNQKQRS
jgi:hypothetical protein